MKLKKVLQNETDPSDTSIHSLILKTLGIGVWSWDLRTNALEWDDNMFLLYGLEKKDFTNIYDAWENSLSAAAKEKAVAEINAAVRGEKDFDTTFQVVQKSGVKKEIRTLAYVTRDTEGTAISMHGIIIDRTHEVELEAEMIFEKAKSARAAKLASLGEISAGIAHEINNPLTVISGMCRALLRAPEDNAKLAYRIGKIEKAVERISKIVCGLKRIASNGGKAEHSLHSLSEIISEALTLAEIKSKKFGAEIRTKISTDAKISCDPLEIEQVIINLMNNAIDAIENMESRWVEIQAFDGTDEVILRIIDSGHGIPTEMLPKLFDPFFTTKASDKGTGLGLSISFGIVKDHGGSLQVVSNHPNTCFEIRIPTTQALTAPSAA